MKIINLKRDIDRSYISTVNCTKSTAKVNKFIVIHYVGATGDAKANAIYGTKIHYDAKGNRIYTSAHYFVGFKGDIWQSVDVGNVAWHCGAQRYTHGSCRNTNSIGIEMCCKKNTDGTWRFTNETIDSTVLLTATLMLQYDIPISNVIRHNDVTGKICPEPYVRDQKAWSNFLKRVKETYKNLLGSYVTMKIVALRDMNLNKVPNMIGMSSKMIDKCEQEKNKVMVKKGSVFQIVGIKQDDTNGDIWGITKSGYIIPLEYNKGIKAIKL